jgi:hypothetical protein
MSKERALTGHTKVKEALKTLLRYVAPSMMVIQAFSQLQSSIPNSKISFESHKIK